MTALPDGYERRYVTGGRVAHAVRVERQSSQARCGFWVAGFGAWRGTGSPAERQRAASLPPCARCDRYLFGEGKP